MRLAVGRPQQTAVSQAKPRAVPEPPLSTAEIVPTIRARVRHNGHSLYRFKSGLACHRFQRWRNSANSHFWARVGCLPQAPVIQPAGAAMQANPDIDVGNEVYDLAAAGENP